MRFIDPEVWKLDLLLLHGFNEKTAWIIDRINHAPTVDAVPVIRCKDCKYRDEQTTNCTRFRKDWYVQSNSFCSWAERKEE